MDNVRTIIHLNKRSQTQYKIADRELVSREENIHWLKIVKNNFYYAYKCKSEPMIKNTLNACHLREREGDREISCSL